MQVTKANEKCLPQHPVALLVHSCDGYELLYKGFGYFFSANWNWEIPCQYYFATEEKKAVIQGFTPLLSGKGQWSDRLRYLLENEISEPYILYFQEDMWLNKKVNRNFFTALFSLAAEKKWKQVKLHSSEVYHTTPTPYCIEGFAIALLVNQTSGFLMSHQVTLWEKNHLLAQLKRGEHPWRNERKGTKRLRKENGEIYQADYFAENGKPEINANPSPVMRSEYQAVSVNGMLNSNVLPFLKELEKGNKEDREYAQKLLHHYTNRLTHNGKLKPRKEDLFKKIKYWMRNQTG